VFTWAGSLARDDDPFATQDRLPDGVSTHELSRFGDQRWYYTVLSRRKTEVSRTVNWADFPETLRESFRRAGWALVNLPTPDALLERAATCRVEWPRPGTMEQVFAGWRRFAGWLADRGTTGLHEVSEDVLVDYAAHVRTVAVGTGLTAGPPHRSQRAGLPHWAPALGFGVKPHVRVRVHDAHFREPSGL